jgi:glycosyltransferase involved in cell wall biosynthesis
MKTSSILINPVGLHHRETFGLVVAQAMLSGCIPISSGEGNLSHLINDRSLPIFGDINSDNWINEAVGKIKTIFSIKDLLGLRCRYRDEVQKYTWEETALKFLRLCDQS